MFLFIKIVESDYDLIIIFILYNYFIIIFSLYMNIYYKQYNYFISLYMGIGDWGWGLGIGDWAQSPIPNPQSPYPKFWLN